MQFRTHNHASGIIAGYRYIVALDYRCDETVDFGCTHRIVDFQPQLFKN